ncbi:MAG: hypothetical protein HQL50_09820 [Magnetococcales bacterium]|nr:hypothetical protein [Magnetococcales bacterium]
MSCVALIEQLKTRDIHLWVESDRLHVDAPSGSITPDLQNTLQNRKAELVEILSSMIPQAGLGEEPTHIPPGHKAQLLSALDRFQTEHGVRLAALGWGSATLFHDMGPESAQTYDDMPGMVMVIANGGRLVRATWVFLEFETTGGRLLWVHPGYWLGGDAAKGWMDRRGEQS